MTPTDRGRAQDSPLHGTALITGATSGLGLTFARALAARGLDLVIVARTVSRLEEVAAELRSTHGIDVEVIPADLSLRDETLRIAARLEDDTRPIEVLINNAGHGLHHKLADPDTTPHEEAIDLMIRSVLILGGAAARTMKDRGHGAIVNVASVAGTIAMGHYSAIKGWVRMYSEALALEMEGTGVTVQTLMPGWVRTEFHERAGIRTRSVPGVLWLEADDVVRESLEDLDRRRRVSIPSLRFKAVAWGTKHLPGGLLREVTRRIHSDRDKGKRRVPRAMADRKGGDNDGA